MAPNVYKELAFVLKFVAFLKHQRICVKYLIDKTQGMIYAPAIRKHCLNIYMSIISLENVG